MLGTNSTVQIARENGPRRPVADEQRIGAVDHHFAEVVRMAHEPEHPVGDQPGALPQDERLLRIGGHHEEEPDRVHPDGARHQRCARSGGWPRPGHQQPGQHPVRCESEQEGRGSPAPRDAALPVAVRETPCPSGTRRRRSCRTAPGRPRPRRTSHRTPTSGASTNGSDPSFWALMTQASLRTRGPPSSSPLRCRLAR